MGWLKGGTRAWNGGSEGRASLTCAGGGLPLALAGFCERGEGERLVSGGRETRYGWQGVAPAVHAGKWERSALVAVGMEWVARAAGPIARAGAGTCGRGDARPKSRLEGAEAGVQGRRVRVRARARAKLVLGAASWEQTSGKRGLSRTTKVSGALERRRDCFSPELDLIRKNNLRSRFQ